MESETRDEGEIRRMPVGIRAAIVFLRVFVVLMYIALFFGLLYCGVLLVAMSHEERISLRSIGESTLVLGVSIALLMTTASGEWMARFLETRFSPPKDGVVCPIQRHPVRVIGAPVLFTIFSYSFVAVLSWCLAKIIGYPCNWAWLIFWTVVAVGTLYASRLLRRYFPA